MSPAQIQQALDDQEEKIAKIRENAHKLHESVNQHYGKDLPYSVHLDMVARITLAHMASVCQEESHMLPIIFAAYFHDSIEDARQTYNDVKEIALNYMDEKQATLAAEIVYALTNEKGRTRAERAGEKYYQGIRETPYAPFVKMADRLANLTHSFKHNDAFNLRMQSIYHDEWENFISKITVKDAEPTRSIPNALIEEAEAIFR